MAYFRDWFGRSAEDAYTSYDSSKRAINWDKGYDNYSDYFFGRRTTSAHSTMKIQDAASLLATMSKVVGIDSSKFKAAVLTPRKDAVAIPTDMLKDSSISTDVFIGAALQNMAKINYQSQEEIAHDARQQKSLNLQKTVYNILNAERLNNLMGDDTPGYLKFVQKFKKHKYKERPHINPEDKFQRALELFDRIIRYPENITDEELEEFKEPLDFIKKNIEKAGGIPSDQKECVKLSKKIAKVLDKYIEETPPTDKDDDEGDGESDGTEGGASAPMSEEEKKRQQEERKEFMEALVDAMSPKENRDKDIFNAFMEDIKSEEESGGKIDKQVEFIVEKDNAREYDDAAKEVDHTKASVIANLLRRKNRDYQFSLKSMRSGRLDTDKLAEAKQGVQTIYERMGEVRTNKLCVTILVDESGSMAGYRADKAREAAIFLKESLESVPDVELFIYGHTADLPPSYLRGLSGKGGSGSTQIFVYKEKGTAVPPKAMGAIHGRYENRDGVAILATAKRVRQRTQNQGVFIVISDGSPSAQNYGGHTAREHVKRSAIEVEKMGFQVIQVTIGGYKSKDMFKNVIDMEDMDKFPTQFVSFLKTKINSLIKEKITM